MTHIHGALKEKTHSWKGVYYHIYEALTENPEISCQKLLESENTQHALRKLIHTHGVEHVTEKFSEMFDEIKGSF